MTDTTELRRQIMAVLEYDPGTGQFTWNQAHWKRGQRAGAFNDEGYVKITFKDKGYAAHRLAWLFTHGAWPEGEIDHINGNRADNRIDNLRVADRYIQTQNKRAARKDSRSGLIGAKLTSSGKFSSSIKADGQEHYLGMFATAELAHAAYMDAKRRLHRGSTV